MQVAQKYQSNHWGIVIFDEPGQHQMAEKDFVVYLNTFSRTVAPSFRVGYMVLPERLVEIFDQKLGFYSCTVPVFEQYVLAELIESGDFERHINRVRRARRKNSKKV